MPEAAAAFAGGLMKSGYMFPLIMGTQLLVGILLLMNRFVPLALLLIMPVLVNIIAFHVFLQPAGVVPGAVLMVIELYLAWCYRSAYRPLLTARAAQARHLNPGQQPFPSKVRLRPQLRHESRPQRPGTGDHA